jgi:histidine decarboxylase
MALWILVARNGYPEFFKRAQRTLELANYAYNKLDELSEKLKQDHDGFDIWLQRSPLSMAIIFRKPIDEIMFKYSLCVADVDEAWDEKSKKVVPVRRTYVHMFCMWDRNEKMFDALVDDLKSPNSFDPCSEQKLTEKAHSDGKHVVMRIRRSGGMF